MTENGPRGGDARELAAELQRRRVRAGDDGATNWADGERPTYRRLVDSLDPTGPVMPSGPPPPGPGGPSTR